MYDPFDMTEETENANESKTTNVVLKTKQILLYQFKAYTQPAFQEIL